MNRRRKQDGFTLIELLVVVGIIAVMGAVALPNLVGFIRGARIREAQNLVSDQIQRARSRAILRNAQMGVSFVTQNNQSFWVHNEDAVPGTGGMTSADVGNRQTLNVTTPNAVLSTSFVLPQFIEFALVAADCPAVAGFVANQNSIRFDRYGNRSLPGTGAGTSADPTIPAVTVTGAVAVGMFRPNPSTGEIVVCLVDRRSGLRSTVRIGAGGRVRKG